jgi:peptide/nickel transport system permease protein
MGIPNFFLAVLLIQLFAVKLGWLPPAGPGGLDNLALPAVVLAMESMAVNMRLMRSSTLEELSKDYVRTLNAKGLPSKRILWVHALRNALVPVIALAGVTIPLVLGYTLIVEVIFRYEGLGFQFVQSITKRDYALAQTLALLFTAIVIMSNFLADVAHQLVDPRIRDRARSA